MPLLGPAAVVIWSDMADPADHDQWHTREHIPERIGIPGFLRARRCVTSAPGEPRYFVLYEVADAAVMTSEGYLRRLNHPTKWTTATMAQVRSQSRTLCRVSASHGVGCGAHLHFVRLTPDPRHTGALRQWIAGSLRELVQQPGIIGAHLMERDEAMVAPQTVERQLRQNKDQTVDWVILVEGYDEAAVRAAADAALAHNEVAARGGLRDARSTYMLHHLAIPGDL